MKNVLIVGSGKSAHQIKEIDTNNLLTVAVNHGWMANNKWDLWIHSTDYRGQKPDGKVDVRKSTKDYPQSINKYGGHAKCGHSIMLCSSYYVLDNYSPSNIFYLGADMNYTPDSDGSTHIYGKGLDIIKNGISDPDRMVNYYGKGDPNFLKNIYTRFLEIAKENKCNVWNLSHDLDTRLPYPRIDYNELRELTRKA